MDDSAQTDARNWSVFNVDLRGDAPENRSLDALIPIDECAREMRRTEDDRTIPVAALEGVILEFGRMSGEALPLLGVTAPDVFYRAVCRLTVLDRFTRIYVRTVVKYYFSQLVERGVCCFYLVDNTIRNDRFQALVELFELAGFAVVSPHLTTASWPDLDARLRRSLAAKRHVWYVEKDASVNFLGAAKALAADSECSAAFRVEASETPAIRILGMPRLRPD
jgi:hypothetical protein